MLEFIDGNLRTAQDRPMKIIVLADTHIPERAEDLPEKIYEDLKTAQLIIHAGDFTSPELLKKLKKICKVKAVAGNMDDLKLKKRLPVKQLITIPLPPSDRNKKTADKLRIGLMHGWGAPAGLKNIIKKEFVKEKPNIIIFGHSHQPLIERDGNTLFFNPGSATDLIFAKTRTYGIITIDATLIEANKVKTEIVRV